jgi:hypothetical protein
VVIAWVFFRAENLDEAFAMLQAMAGLNGLVTPDGMSLENLSGVVSTRNQILLAMLLVLVFCAPNSQEWIMSNGQAHKGFAMPQWRPNAIWAGVLAACFLFTLTRLSAVSEFIYFNF